MLSDRCQSVCPVCNVGVLWPNGLMDQDATWYVGRPRPRRHCVRWGPNSPRKAAQQPAPTFRPTFRSPISATAELLYCLMNRGTWEGCERLAWGRCVTAERPGNEPASSPRSLIDCSALYLSIIGSVAKPGCQVAQLVKCLVTSGYPDGSWSGGPLRSLGKNSLESALKKNSHPAVVEQDCPRDKQLSEVVSL